MVLAFSKSETTLEFVATFLYPGSVIAYGVGSIFLIKCKGISFKKDYSRQADFKLFV